jgi:ATP-dependent Clp protease adaptor protein ClpS
MSRHQQTTKTPRTGEPISPTKVEDLSSEDLSIENLLIENSWRSLSAQAGNSADQGGDHGDDETGGSGTATISKPKSKTKTPSLYRVILINDDFTPMEFVIHVLQKFFQKEYTEATQIMLQVHNQGAGVCGMFTYEIAEMKVYMVNQYSRENRHPLKCTMERA